MTTHTVSFVPASEVFEGYPDAWTRFVEGDPDCSWGNNNVTLVTADTLLSCATDEFPEALITRIEGLCRTYVDLES